MDERRMTAQFAFPKQQELVDYDLKVKRQTALRFAFVPKKVVAAPCRRCMERNFHFNSYFI